MVPVLCKFLQSRIKKSRVIVEKMMSPSKALVDIFGKH